MTRRAVPAPWRWEESALPSVVPPGGSAGGGGGAMAPLGPLLPAQPTRVPAPWRWDDGVLGNLSAPPPPPPPPPPPVGTGEYFQYLELWDKLQAQGGIRLAFLGMPIQARRRMRLNGDDALAFNLHKTRWCISLLRKGAVVREILSLDGTLWREWPIETLTRTSGDELLVPVNCFPPYHLLTNYPIETVDADGYVYQETSALQLTPAQVIINWIRSRTPSWIVSGTIEPTALVEVPFSGESALQGLRRLEELTGKEGSLTPIGTTQYGINLMTIGATAATLYLRTQKNLKRLEKQVVPGQINRLHVIRGADGDDGPSSIAWAYWEVEATSGSGPYRIKLKSIHSGGDGPIKYDGQLSHVNLPGGVDSLYAEIAETGSRIQITDSFVATQEIEVASLAGVSIGYWIRIVASSTGKQLNFLDAPAELAANGEQGGQFESAYDDTVCVPKNSLMAAWASTLPDGWTGVGTKTTVATDVITAGQALSINQSVADGGVIASPPARVWYIANRRSFFSATAFIRLRAATSAGDITFRLKANGTVVGTGLVYQSPINAYVQLKISGLDLGAYVGTAPSLTAEIVKSNGTGVVNMLVDDICFGPSLNARAPTEGANAARIWQEANRFLEDSRPDQITYKASAADLDRMGRATQVPIVIGQAVVVDDWELGTVTQRLVEKNENPVDARDGDYVLSTLEPRRSREKAKLLPLVIPFFEPIAVQMAGRDTRNAALLIKAQITATSSTQVTILLTVVDSLGGGPAVAYAAFGASYVSGSGSGPYVFNRPAAGAGTGRVVFTASLPGRTDAYDAVDVVEQVSSGVAYSEVRTSISAVTATTVEITVTSASPAGSPTVELVSVNGSAALSVGPAIGVPAASGTNWLFTRGAFGAGLGEAIFRAVLAGTQSDDDSVAIAEVGRDTVAVTGRVRVISSTLTSVTVRAAMSDPFPQGAGTGTISYLDNSTLGVAPGTPQSVTPAATITEAAGTYVDFTIQRGVFGYGTGRVAFTFAAAGRISDTDSVDVPASEYPAPTWAVRQDSETDTTVTVTVVITNDPQSLVTGVEFATQVGQGAVSSFVLDATAPYTKTVTLIEGQTSKVFFRINGQFESGASGVIAEDFVTVKASAMPTPPILNLSMDTAGIVIARIEGDDLTQSLRWASSLSAMPSDATVDGATASNNRQVTTGTLQTVSSSNRTCYVKAVAHSATSGGGTKSVYVQAILTYTVAVTKTLRIPFSELLPSLQTIKWSANSIAVSGNSDSAILTLRGSVVLPVGVTVTSTSARVIRNNSATCTVILYRINADAATLIAQPVNNPANSASWQTGTAALSEMVGAADSYSLQVELGGTASANDAQFSWLELTYSSPSYEVTY